MEYKCNPKPKYNFEEESDKVIVREKEGTEYIKFYKNNNLITYYEYENDERQFTLYEVEEISK